MVDYNRITNVKRAISVFFKIRAILWKIMSRFKTIVKEVSAF